jgi:tetratricopeptide (TPR) repeat protein
MKNELLLDQKLSIKCKINISINAMKTIRLMTLVAIVLFATNVNAQSKKAQENSEKKGSSLNLPEPKSASDIGKTAASIAYILKNKIEINDKKYQLSDTPEDLVVLDDRIEFKIKKESSVIYFTDFLDYVIPPPYSKKGKIILSLDRFEFITNGFNSNFKRLEELRQNLIFIQKQSKIKRDESQRILFEQKASEYLALKVKPQVSEEQRKFIVQANAFNQQKNYVKAIELYTKAIEVDQTAYPAGYSNLALLSAQVNNFSAAINYMKRYLLLEPAATDARSAQDKIYEWEAMIQK